MKNVKVRAVPPNVCHEKASRLVSAVIRILVVAFALLGGTIFIEGVAFGEPITICVVQTNEGQDAIQQAGMDAKHLAKSLMESSLPAGDTILPMLVIGLPKKAVAADVERRGCAWVVEITRHDSADSSLNNWSPPSQLAASAGPVPDVSPIGDRDALLYSLHRAGSKKVVAHGSAPPETYRGHGVTPVFSPYPLFARQIVKKISQTSDDR